jgi:hypothetical protein
MVDVQLYALVNRAGILPDGDLIAMIATYHLVGIKRCSTDVGGLMPFPPYQAADAAESDRSDSRKNPGVLL